MLKVEEEDRKSYNEYMNSEETDNSGTRIDVFKYEACVDQEEDSVERVLNVDDILDLS